MNHAEALSVVAQTIDQFGLPAFEVDVRYNATRPNPAWAQLYRPTSVPVELRTPMTTDRVAVGDPVEVDNVDALRIQLIHRIHEALCEMRLDQVVQVRELPDGVLYRLQPVRLHANPFNPVYLVDRIGYIHQFDGSRARVVFPGSLSTSGPHVMHVHVDDLNPEPPDRHENIQPT